MEPITKSDLKELMKELRESMKESIRETVAAGFGNSKPALEQATTSTASQLLSPDPSDDNKDLAPACSSPDQGTYALDLGPATTIDVLPELDIDATGVAEPTPTTCSTDGLIHNTHGDDKMESSKAAWSTPTPYTVHPGDSPTPSSEPALGLALGALAQTKCLTECSGQLGASIAAGVIPATTGCMPTTCSAEWVTNADCRIINSSSTTLPIRLAAAAVHRSWVQTVPPHPPDLRLFFWWDHGCLMSGSSDLERVIHLSPNESLCTRQCQEVKLSCLFHVMSISWQWLVHWLVYGVDLRPIPWPSFSTGEPSNVDCSSVANWDPHVPISVDDKFLKHLFLSVQVHDNGMVVVPSLALIGLLTVLEVTFTIHGGFLLMDGLWGWSLHLLGRVKISDDKQDAPCSLVCLKLQQLGLFVVYLTNENSLCSCHYTVALAFDWRYNHISYRQLVDICCKRLKCEWRIQSGLVQTTFSRNGAVTCRTMELLVVELPECIDDQLAELLKNFFNEMSKCSVTLISCEIGCKLHNTSFLIWRTSAVCLLLCFYDQFQRKLAGLFYHLSNCCLVTLLRLPVSVNCLTLRYAGHKNQIYHMKLSHSNHSQEGINLQVEQIWCAITSNTLDAYPCGGEDHARESLFNLELAGVAFKCSFLLDAYVRSGELIQPMSKDFSCMCFCRDTYIEVQTFWWYVSQPKVQFRASELDCILGKSTKVLELLLASILRKMQYVGGNKNCALQTPWNPGDLIHVELGYWITAYEQEPFQGGRYVIAPAIPIYQVYGVLHTSLGGQNLPELNRGMKITVWVLPFHAAMETSETRSSWLGVLFQCRGQGDIFQEISLPPCFLLPLVMELPLWWDPGGEEFFEYFMHTEAEGGRNNKSAPYCADQFSCFDLTCSFKQVPVVHKFYFNFDQVHAGSDDQLCDAASFDLAQVYFQSGYRINTKKCRVSWDPGAGIGLGSSRVSRREGG